MAIDTESRAVSTSPSLRQDAGFAGGIDESKPRLLIGAFVGGIGIGGQGNPSGREIFRAACGPVFQKKPQRRSQARHAHDGSIIHDDVHRLVTPYRLICHGRSFPLRGCKASPSYHRMEGYITEAAKAGASRAMSIRARLTAPHLACCGGSLLSSGFGTGSSSGSTSGSGSSIGLGPFGGGFGKSRSGFGFLGSGIARAPLSKRPNSLTGLIVPANVSGAVREVPFR